MKKLKLFIYKLMLKHYVFLFLLNTSFLCSCSNKIHQLYSGPKRSLSEIAVLTSFDPVRLLKIDKRFGPGNKEYGYTSRWNYKCIAELEPGNHDLVAKTVRSSNKIYPSGNYLVNKTEYSISDLKELSFLVEAGKVYQIIETEGNIHIIEVKQIPSARKPYDINNRAN